MRYRLNRREAHEAGYFVLWFEPVSDADSESSLPAAAGQFAMIRGEDWGEAPLLARPMSLLSVEPQGVVSMLIKVVGEGTRQLASAAIGSSYSILAPLGRPWAMPSAGRSALMVAGGVGVAPLIHLAHKLASLGQAPHSLYGGRSAVDLPLATELEDLGSLTVVTEDGSRGVKGRVTIALEAELERRAAAQIETQIYCCGPHAMMAAVAVMAERFGVACAASLEAPMGCGYGVCLGCPVARKDGSYLYTCVDGPCVDAALIDFSRPVF